MKKTIKKQKKTIRKQKETIRKRVVWIFFILSLFWMGVIFFFSAQPAVQSSKLSTDTTQWLLSSNHSILKDLTEQLHRLDQKGVLEFFIRKLAHAAEYGILAVFLGITISFHSNWNRKWQLKTVGLCGLYACTDEFHQLFVPGRAGQIRDVVIDTAGAVCAVLLIWLCFAVFQRRTLQADSY